MVASSLSKAAVRARLAGGSLSDAVGVRGGPHVWFSYSFGSSCTFEMYSNHDMNVWSHVLCCNHDMCVAACGSHTAAGRPAGFEMHEDVV